MTTIQRLFTPTFVFLLSLSFLLLSGCEDQEASPSDAGAPSEISDSDSASCGSFEETTPISTEKLICAGPGGNLCTPDQNVCLEFPPNSLDVDRRIKLSIAGPEFEIEGKNLLYPGARLEPEGLGFLKPVTARVRVQGADDIDNVSVLLASSPTQYEDLENIARNADTKTITGELWHFSWLYPYLVNAPPPVTEPSLSLHGGPGTPLYGAVGNGGITNVGIYAVVENGTLVWRNGGNTSENLVLQATFPTAVAGQTAQAVVTMEDPGPYTGSGPNARQQWQLLVFNKILGVLQGGIHPTGADGIAIYPTTVNTINWDQLPAGYPSGRASVELTYFDAARNQIGTSTLVLTISRPNF